MMRDLVNFAAFQAAWFANVLGAAAGEPWLGPLVTATWVGVHLALSGDSRAAQWRILVVAAVIGYCADSMLVLGGVIDFPQHARAGGPSPVWMVALWIGFAATLSHSLGWLRGQPILAAGLGAVGGPLAYWAGARLGAIELAPGIGSLVWISVEWAVAAPLLVMAHGLLSRPEREEPSACAPRERTS